MTEQLENNPQGTANIADDNVLLGIILLNVIFRLIQQNGAAILLLKIVS